jgi:hypothetical protein
MEEAVSAADMARRERDFSCAERAADRREEGVA